MGGAAPGGGLLRSHQDLLTAPTTSASLGWRNQRLQRGRPARGRPHLAQPMWPSGRTVQQGQGAHACGTPQHRQHRNGVAFLHPLLCEHRPRRSKWEHGRSGIPPCRAAEGARRGERGHAPRLGTRSAPKESLLRLSQEEAGWPPRQPRSSAGGGPRHTAPMPSSGLPHPPLTGADAHLPSVRAAAFSSPGMRGPRGAEKTGWGTQPHSMG